MLLRTILESRAMSWMRTDAHCLDAYVSDYSFHTLGGGGRNAGRGAGLGKHIFISCAGGVVMDVWVWTGCLSGFKSLSARHCNRSCADLIHSSTGAMFSHLLNVPVNTLQVILWSRKEAVSPEEQAVNAQTTGKRETEMITQSTPDCSVWVDLQPCGTG